jgi:hypothetical protein
MLDKEIRYYKEQRNKLIDLYDGKYIVIKTAKVIGVYDTHIDAYNETIKGHDVGTFIIKNPKKTS